MKLEHTFTVDAPVADVWHALRDLGSTAALLPRAQVSSCSPDRAEGTFQAKLGPMNLRYAGTAEVLKADDVTRTAVLRAEGVNAKHGAATATVTVRLADGEGTTTVHLTTDVTAAGRPGEFDRDAFSEVGARVVGKFAEAFTTALGTTALGTTALGTTALGTTALGTAPAGEPQDPATPSDVAGAVESAAVSSGGQPTTRRPRPRPAPPAEAPRTQAIDATVSAAGLATSRAESAEPPAVRPPIAEPAPSAAEEKPVRQLRAEAAPHRPSAESGPAGVRRAVEFVTRPALVRGVAPAALATVILLGAVRRRRRS